MILQQILVYPSDKLAEIHSEAMKLGNFDLEAESKKAHESTKAESLSKVHLWRISWLIVQRCAFAAGSSGMRRASSSALHLTTFRTWELQPTSFL